MRRIIRSLGRRYTLLIIPDSPEDSRRLRLSALSLLAAGAACTLLVVSAAALLFLRSIDAERIHALYRELAAASESYDDSIEQREQSIVVLQQQVLRLREEAGEVKLRLEELSRLESELEALVTLSLPGEPKRTDTASIDQAAVEYEGIGGEDYPLAEDDEQPASAGQYVSLIALKHEAAALATRLEQKKNEVGRIIETLRITPTHWPADSRRITSEFGIRRDPFTRRKSMHSGVDLGGKSGDPVYAAADGKVTESAYNSSRGHYIVLSHPSGLQSVYMHLRKRHVQAGEQVVQGERIGDLGSTGRSTGPHLHFEIWKNGEPIDPLPYLNLLKEDDHVQVSTHDED